MNITVETTSEATGAYTGEHSFMASTAVEPSAQERPTEPREKELSGAETLGVFGALGGGGKNDCSAKLLVDSGAPKHYLDDLAPSAP